MVTIMNENTPYYANLIDSHFHLLSMKEKGFTISTVLDEMETRGFSGGIDIGIDSTDHLQRVALVKEYPFMRIASGIGPWGATHKQPVSEMVNALAGLFVNSMPDAIGEIGLDFYHNYGTVDKQKELLIEQIELAHYLKLPIIIHTRDADEEMKKVLEQYSYPHGGIIHCFSSSMDFATFALNKGFLLSFAGPITYKKNDELRKVLAYTPLSSLLLETDSPFLAPQTFRGKPNTPTFISLIYEKAAEVKGVEVSEIIKCVNENFSTIFAC